MDILKRSAFVLAAAAVLLVALASAQVAHVAQIQKRAPLSIQETPTLEEVEIAYIEPRGAQDTTTKRSRFLFEFSSEYDPPTLTWVPPNINFTCTGRAPGYYSDPAHKCQVYHLCLPDGRRYSMLCGIGTVFNQRTFVCDHWYAYPCANAERDYQLNEQLWEHVLLPGSSGAGATSKSKAAGATSDGQQQDIGDFPSDEEDYTI